MFSKEFYPTPKALIEKLLKPYEVNEDKKLSRYLGKYDISGSVLEPSAGKGDILDYIDANTKNKIELFSIEKSVELQSILKDKEYQVIESDFLNFNEDEFFDFIIMNPPFSNGVTHLLKAVEISQTTKIACILNAQTIKNPNTKERKKLLEIIEKFGKVEFVQDAFLDAERVTAVEVALVWLDIEKEDTRFNFEFYSTDEIKVNFDFDIKSDAIATNDMINNLSLRYEEVRQAYKEKLRADEKYNYYITAFLSGESMSVSHEIEKQGGTPKQKYSYLSKKLKRFMWHKVINQLDLKKYMSSNVLKNFSQFIGQQSNMSFNKQNVLNFFQFIMNNRVNILENSIIEVFEELTKHGYTENRKFVETWKTNDAYKINRKVITPSYISYGSYMNSQDIKEYGDKFSLNYSSWSNSKLSDLEKVITYISGEENKVSIEDALKLKFDELGKVCTGDKIHTDCQSTFFDIKFYRKGTIHLFFRNESHWKQFNFRACKGKKWIPKDEYQKEKNYAYSSNKNKFTVKENKPKRNPVKKGRIIKSNFSNQLLSLFG
ncbi:DUF4942 domain-containing protein [Tenacibaculum maritimum]|uniref:DUF4942 domain-containing protein n=1 Tax=Tenacibaculum maritimum TaxID=107401 RepID=UPI003876F92B